VYGLTPPFLSTKGLFVRLISPLIVVGILMLLSAHPPLYLPSPLSRQFTPQKLLAPPHAVVCLYGFTHKTMCAVISLHSFVALCSFSVFLSLWWRMKSIDAIHVSASFVSRVPLYLHLSPFFHLLSSSILISFSFRFLLFVCALFVMVMHLFSLGLMC
jgi:hypothetical protein